MSQDSACPTRQQLDELEALMQRMLSLPVSEGEESPSAPPPEPKARAAVLPPRLRAIPDPPPWDDPGSASDAPAPPSTPRLIARPVEVRAPKSPAAAAPTFVHSERVSIEEEMDNVPEMPMAQTAALESLPPAPVVARMKPRVMPKRPLVSRESEEMWWLTPLLWTNHAFDRCTLRLGPSGRWLRGARGRAWIGWSGIFLFALAAAWTVLEWLGLMW